MGLLRVCYIFGNFRITFVSSSTDYLSSEEFELSMDLLGEEGEVELESCLCWRGGCLLAMLGLL